MTETRVIHPLSPVWNSSSRILVLGTMPSPVSRSAGFYYMHPQNAFWPVIASVFGRRLLYANNGSAYENSSDSFIPDIAAAVEERRMIALADGLALWDVLRSCDISGAEDASIKNPVPNDLSEILSETHITQIFCTGQTAFKLYTKLCVTTTGIPAVCLPSTSPANRGRWPFEKLVQEYRRLKA